MPIEQLIILAIIQGITEFLPISSSAHLILLPALTDWQDQGTVIDVAVHVGSLFAVMGYFHRDVRHLFQGLFDAIRFNATDNSRLLGYLILATIPVYVFGFVLVMLDLTASLRSVEVIGWATLIFGAFLYHGDRIGATVRGVADLTLGRVALIGLAQAFAVIPGTSRSGVTITMARYIGMNRQEAARFSMLLSLPTIAGAGLWGVLEIREQASSLLQSDALLAAGLSFVSALIAISIFMKMLERMTLTVFVIYRAILGVGLLAYAYLF